MSSIPSQSLTSSLDSYYSINSYEKYLSEGNYKEATISAQQVAGTNPPYMLPLVRIVTILHFEKTNLTDCGRLLLQALLEKDCKTGLDSDWVKAQPKLFEEVINLYVDLLTKKGLTPEKLTAHLKKDLSAFLTFSSFGFEQAKSLIAHIPNFDPRKKIKSDNPHSDTFLETAKRFSKSQELITYFESLSPAPAYIEVDYEAFDYTPFVGVTTLKGIQQANLIQKKGEFVLLDTLGKIYQLIGKNSVIEGQREFFKNQMKTWVEDYHVTPEYALGQIQQSYQATIQAVEAVKALLENHQINVYAVEELAMVHSLSSQENLGIVTLNETTAVCKFIKTIHTGIMSDFAPIENVANFVIQSRKLKLQVPNLVETYPTVILHKKEQSIAVGYLMEIAPGKPLRQIQTFSSSELKAIQEQFNTSVETMLKAGYALYDFHDENVLWDGKKLTFIDLSATGFTQSALDHADTFDVIMRMNEMLAKKKLIS